MLVLLDDLPRINPLDQEQGPPALSWLPLQLPPNIHMVCTSALGPDALRLTTTQKERLRSPECLIQLPPAPGEQGGDRASTTDHGSTPRRNKVGSFFIRRLEKCCSFFGEFKKQV